MVLRSKTPELVKQEFFGLLLAHHAVRKLMDEAALKADLDPTLPVVPTHGPRGPSQAAAVRRYPPLRTGRRCMRPFCPRSWTSRWIPVAAAGTRAG